MDEDASNQILLGELTAPEIRDIGAADGSILIIPVGSLEQHGPHLPVATDTILAEAVSKRGATRVADEVPVVVAPGFWSGFSPHHLSLGGTASLDFEHMLGSLEDLAATLLPNGFDAILFMNGHGGNSPVIGAALNTIGPKYPDVDVLGMMYFDLIASHAEELREGEVVGTHAGEIETALIMHLRPELVREGEMEPVEHTAPMDAEGGGMFTPGVLSAYRDFETYTAIGSEGDPTVATPEKGEEVLELVGEEFATVLREIHDVNSGAD